MKEKVEYIPVVEVAGFSGRGRVYSWTRITERDHAPEGFTDFVPYINVLVKLEEGPLVTARLTDVDYEDIHFDMEVECVTRLIKKDGDRGLLIYGYSFRPPIPESTETLAETIERIYAEEYEFGLRKKN